MKEFCEKEYETLIANLLHDTHYIEISNMGKLKGLRQQAEILVRKLLNIGSDNSIMLGQVIEKSSNKVIEKRINRLEDGIRIQLIEIVNRINIVARESAHTKRTDEYTNEEIKQVENSILDLYALLFINYFIKYKVDIYFSPIVLHEFSILPPIIRYKTWNYLYEQDKNNIQVVNKLCLSIIKTYDKEKAFKWLNKNEEDIRKIPYPTAEEKIKYIYKGGVEIEPGKYQVSLDFDSYDNMYDLLYAKTVDSRTSINESGVLYKTFEEAIIYFKEYKKNKVYSEADEEKELHSLMEFVYLGRKEDN